MVGGIFWIAREGNGLGSLEGLIPGWLLAFFPMVADYLYYSPGLLFNFNSLRGISGYRLFLDAWITFGILHLDGLTYSQIYVWGISLLIINSILGE